jgi:hypothetical protein
MKIIFVNKKMSRYIKYLQTQSNAYLDVHIIMIIMCSNGKKLIHGIRDGYSPPPPRFFLVKKA